MIKAIRYPHMWRYNYIFTCEEIDDFTDIKFVSKWILLKIVGVSSKHLPVFLKSLWNFWKFLENLRNNFGKSVFRNLRKVVGNLRKIIKKRGHQYVYIIKRTLHVGLKIWILCSHGKNNISLVCCAHSWDIALATRT